MTNDRIRPRRRYGQHFLHDPAIIRRIVDAIAPERGQLIYEIGPGQGALTGPLLDAVHALTVVEIDPGLAAQLRERCAHRGRLEIHVGDALAFDFAANAGGSPVRVVGNLPYNVSTPLLFHLLRQAPPIEDMHFMLQREVAERIEAPPGSPAYGRLSVMVQLRCEPSLLFRVGAGAFRPAPRVTSAFLRLRVRSRPAVAVSDEATFQALVRQLFSHRRKTVRNALKGWLTVAEIEAAGVAPTARPQGLGLTQLAALADARFDRSPAP